MSLLFMDGFAHYDASTANKKYDRIVDTDSSIGVGTSYGRYSGCGMRLIGADGVSKLYPANRNVLVAFAVRFNSFPASATRLMSIGVNGNSAVTLGVDASGFVGLSASSAGGANLSGFIGAAMILGQWHYIQVRHRSTTAALAGDSILTISGTTAYSSTAGSTTSAGGNELSNRITFGDQGGAPSVGMSVDIADVNIRSWTSASTDGALWGDRVVQTLWPDSAGADTALTVTGAATALAAVTENPPDSDTSYISSATPGDSSTFTLTNLSGTPSVSGVQINALARKDAAGTRVMSPVIRISGTDYLTGAVGQFDSYTYGMFGYELNPATGVAWTASGINGIEAGVNVNS